MSAAKKGSERKVRSSAVPTDEEKRIYGATIDHAASLVQETGDSRRLIELGLLLEETKTGQQAIKASIDTLKRFHEPSIPQAILMPMAIGIMIGLTISQEAHERTTRRKPSAKASIQP
jgi:hypothetical protein